MNDSQEMCACGMPLHYERPEDQQDMQELIELVGIYKIIDVPETGKKYRVPRHYIALHGLQPGELPWLAQKYSFREIMPHPVETTKKRKRQYQKINKAWETM